MSRCSIIIPTYNNSQVVARALSALWQQRVPKLWQIEVIVSDDGSHDATVAVVRSSRPPADWQFHVLTGSHVGPAQVRNRAIARATGDIVLLLQADIALRPGSLAAHLLFHSAHPSINRAALGFIAWDPRLPPSRLMVWMMHGGQHNNYDALLGTTTADPRHFFYGALLSLKREMLSAHTFSTAFSGYGWEDLELGRRLARQGLTLEVLPNSQGLHMHYYSVAAVCRRQYAAGKNLHIYHRLHEGDRLAPTALRYRQLKYYVVHYLRLPYLLQAIVTRTERFLVTPRLFRWLTEVYFWEGWYSTRG